MADAAIIGQRRTRRYNSRLRWATCLIVSARIVDWLQSIAYVASRSHVADFGGCARAGGAVRSFDRHLALESIKRIRERWVCFHLLGDKMPPGSGVVIPDVSAAQGKK